MCFDNMFTSIRHRSFLPRSWATVAFGLSLLLLAGSCSKPKASSTNELIDSISSGKIEHGLIHRSQQELTPEELVKAKAVLRLIVQAKYDPITLALPGHPDYVAAEPTGYLTFFNEQGPVMVLIDYAGGPPFHGRMPGLSGSANDYLFKGSPEVKTAYDELLELLDQPKNLSDQQVR